VEEVSAITSWKSTLSAQIASHAALKKVGDKFGAVFEFITTEDLEADGMASKQLHFISGNCPGFNFNSRMSLPQNSNLQIIR
jgi:hypothetical protein